MFSPRVCLKNWLGLGEGRATDGSWGRMSPKRGQWDQSQGGNTGQCETRLRRKQTSTVFPDNKCSGRPLHRLSFCRGLGRCDPQLTSCAPSKIIKELRMERGREPLPQPPRRPQNQTTVPLGNHSVQGHPDVEAFGALPTPTAPRAPADSKLGLDMVSKRPGPLQPDPSHISRGPSWAE